MNTYPASPTKSRKNPVTVMDRTYNGHSVVMNQRIVYMSDSELRAHKQAEAQKAKEPAQGIPLMSVVVL